MANLIDIKRRIGSVKNTQKITRAMKMVAAAKLRRAQEAILQARPYAHRMRDLIHSIARRAELDAHPLLRRPAGEGKIDLIVITSDRGLCGAFNSNIVNAALTTIEAEFPGRTVELTAIGRRGIDLLKRKPCTIRATYTDVLDEDPMAASKKVIEDVIQGFLEGQADEVYCLYNEFKSAISQRVTLEKLLPFEPESAGHDEAGDASNDAAVDYIYEPSVQTVFTSLLSKHMQIQMHRILFESAASEHGARMTAMDSATNNAGEMIDKLTLIYNRARQDTITTELIEVVSGAEAL